MAAAVKTLSAQLPRLYLGTMTFGWEQASSFVDATVGSEMIERARAIGVTYLDSARIYSGGATEPIVGINIYILHILSVV
jgi:aryl-alcohol dehydrogenase-like predicted oxidoreductase